MIAGYRDGEVGATAQTQSRGDNTQRRESATSAVSETRSTTPGTHGRECADDSDPWLQTEGLTVGNNVIGKLRDPAFLTPKFLRSSTGLSTELSAGVTKAEDGHISTKIPD